MGKGKLLTYLQVANKTDDAQTETKEVEEAPKEVEEAVTLLAVGTLPKSSPFKTHPKTNRKVVIVQPPMAFLGVSTRC